MRRSNTDHSLVTASYNNHSEPNISLSAVPHSASADISNLDQSNETGEQILAKYRRQGGNNFSSENTPLVDLSDISAPEETVPSSVRPYYDSSNVTNCQAFIDVKRKLRMVLASVDVGTLPSGLDVVSGFGYFKFGNF